MKYGSRPDVGVLFKSGKIKIIEIASKTGKVSILKSRNINFMKLHNLQGSVRVNKWAQRLDRIWPLPKKK
ncbi:hypothetical protein [Aureispira anguillae]|uniref:Uncharacterized protein n=1 Tax=Aureispira anguillae TaxID=2864201 RepID=A0A916DRM7_9BACT|nr:hypothetical protein [Aureispira anguillae]BDS11949.1 hypothetical protein AsAng_0026640 [Aureispira anguillae]